MEVILSRSIHILIDHDPHLKAILLSDNACVVSQSLQNKKEQRQDTRKAETFEIKSCRCFNITITLQDLLHNMIVPSKHSLNNSALTVCHLYIVVTSK